MRPTFEEAKKLCEDRKAEGVEVGVDRGLNAQDVLHSWPDLELTLVDNYCLAPDREAVMRANVASYTPSILLLDSITAAEKLKDRRFDFVYIDADHTYEGVKADLDAWYPLVKKGGVFGGDDYLNTTCPGVNKAVNEFVVKHELFLNVQPNGGAVDWFVHV
jgi:predicted O-methyltransferase YrrM